MKIAVMLSSYNGEQFICHQIESILEQEGDFQLELIVRDDGSTDSTTDILDRYQAAGKLRWYKGENLKPAKSFLDLVKNCSGYDFYAFADQDDVWYPDKLQTSIDRIKDHQKPAMAFSNARLVDAELVSLGRNAYSKPPQHDFYSVLCGGGILGCTVVYNEQCAQILRTYAEPEKLIMHDSYAAILCTLFDGVIEYDHAPHMDYRQHGRNVIGTRHTKSAALKERISRITKPIAVSISQMAQSILDQNPTVADADKLAFLKQVADYRTSFPKALALACSKKPHYNSRNMAITLRLAIALRNR